MLSGNHVILYSVHLYSTYLDDYLPPSPLHLKPPALAPFLHSQQMILFPTQKKPSQTLTIISTLQPAFSFTLPSQLFPEINDSFSFLTVLIWPVDYNPFPLTYPRIPVQVIPSSLCYIINFLLLLDYFYQLIFYGCSIFKVKKLMPFFLLDSATYLCFLPHRSSSKDLPFYLISDFSLNFILKTQDSVFGPPSSLSAFPALMVSSVW